MNILATQYSLKHRSLDLYLAGCSRRCEDCHNPESWDFKSGVLFDEKYAASLSKKLSLYGRLVKNIFILGGEPLDQPYHKLIHLLKCLETTGKKIWLFTSYDIEEVDYSILTYLDFIKCGIYDKENIGENEQFGIKLATTNQKIYEIKEWSFNVNEEKSGFSICR